jgi:hypothetical protein
VGYLADRNLHAFEEFELGLRLRAKGWRLARLDRIAVDHYGYRTNAYHLLWQRARSGYAAGAGELARATLGRPGFLEVVRKIRTLWTSAFVVAWIVSILAPLALLGGTRLAVLCSAAVVVAPISVMILRRRSLQLGLYAVAVWIVYMIGSVRGFLSMRKDPSAWIPSKVLKDCVASEAEQPFLSPAEHGMERA